MRFKIINERETKFRKDGTMSFFKGRIDFDGSAIDVSLSTKVGDEGADLFAIRDGLLTVTPAHLASIRARAETIAQIKAEQEARDRRHAADTDSLPEIKAVSEKQQAYASRLRLGVVNEILDQVHGSEREAFLAVAATYTDAAFWIRHCSAYDLAHALRSEVRARLSMAA